MKKKFMLAISIFAVSFLSAACGDDNPTEIAWTDSDQSQAAINDIAWDGTDQTWNGGDDGFALGEKTEAKEVSSTTGSVACDVYSAGEFTEAEVEIEGQSDSSINLAEGETNEFTIIAAAKKK